MATGLAVVVGTTDVGWRVGERDRVDQHDDGRSQVLQGGVGAVGSGSGSSSVDPGMGPDVVAVMDQDVDRRGG